MKRNETPAAIAIRTAEAARDEAFQALNDFREDIIAQASEAFFDLGGCEHCHGRGWTVAWDSLDSLSGSFAEYEPCKHCTEDDRAKVGFVNPGCGFSKYDRNRDGLTQEVWFDRLFNTMPEGAEVRAQYKALLADVAKTETNLSELREYYSIRKGCEVRVVKDRGNVTAPIGLVGRVFYRSEKTFGRYGYKAATVRLGLRDENGKVYWTTEKNCVLTDPEPKLDNLVDVRVAAIVRESIKARLVRFFTDKAGEVVETWIPKSAIIETNEQEANTFGSMKPIRFSVERWWHEQNSNVAVA